MSHFAPVIELHILFLSTHRTLHFVAITELHISFFSLYRLQNFTCRSNDYILHLTLYFASISTQSSHLAFLLLRTSCCILATIQNFTYRAYHNAEFPISLLSLRNFTSCTCHYLCRTVHLALITALSFTSRLYHYT